MLLRGRIPAKRLYFYSPFCLTYSSASNLFLSYSLCSLPLSPVNNPPPVSLSLSLPLYPLSHYHSLVSWPGLVLTVLVSIRTLPLGCGPACVWSNGTEICSHSSSRSWWDFLQNISAPDVEFPWVLPCLRSIRHGQRGISFTWLGFRLCMCVEEMLETVKMCLDSSTQSVPG